MSVSFPLGLCRRANTCLLEDVFIGDQLSPVSGREEHREWYLLLQEVPVCIELSKSPILVVSRVLVFPRMRQFWVFFACLLTAQCQILLDLCVLSRCRIFVLNELDLVVRNHKLVLSQNLRREIKKRNQLILNRINESITEVLINMAWRYDQTCLIRRRETKVKLKKKQLVTGSLNKIQKQGMKGKLNWTI